ncbi:ATP-binding protein [Fibrobacter sp. UWB3]|uniref:ATP-binding protein n=1 Tax=Fibrobacter sp. UWB3 TaxID=1964357 RepID=UPI000B51E7B7|nr:ATP-binding protein [Fibrobacter sp. UWB3]OWV16735.1 hypothetical protein B7991_13330 [Fibrobacter sp. UWB3]
MELTFVAIIELISACVTLEECFWAKIPLIGNFFRKQKILSKKWKSDNVVVDACINRFKEESYSEYREHIFSEDEKQKIIQDYFEQNPNLKLNETDRKNVELFIIRVLDGFNEYNRSIMTPGERILHDSVSKGNEKILSSLEELKNQGKEDNKRKFLKAVNHYKRDDSLNIDCKINGEYEIDRSVIINQIKKDDCHLIAIVGEPGSGKSALCKMLLECEGYVLYSRAERLASCNNISEIWNCDLDSLLENGFQEKLCIFIDALEFIADNTESEKNKLQEIFALSRDYKNVYVVASCRTSDKNSFAKLWSNYKVKDYEISELNAGEVESIIQYFPCLKKIKSQKGYSDFLKSPFYVNLIVSKLGDDFEINEENELRKIIWNDVICLRSKASKHGIDCSVIQNIVEKIVFDRAKNFTLGVNKDDLDSKVLNLLLSEKIVVQNGDLIRLSYDIFEDICFEHKFDRFFADCKGDYSKFFSDIDSLGRCAYRRYQIWVSNKIFTLESRKKFLHELIFSHYDNNAWKKQTQIGIVKSKYSHLFFDQYSQKLIDDNLLIEFIKIVNLYGFEGKFVKGNFDYNYLKLEPVGESRECLIRIIESKDLYKNGLEESYVLKLCTDYSNVRNRDVTVSNSVCVIVEYYYELKKNEQEKWNYKSIKDFAPYLSVLYQLADAAKEWLKNFLYDLKCGLRSSNREVQYLSEELVQWTLVKHVCKNLVKELPEDLCDLANVFWLKSGEIKKHNDYDRFDKCDLFGLSDFASDHHFTFGREHGNPFFVCLLNLHFWKAFEWATEFVNHCVLSFVKNKPEKIESCKIYFIEENREREYIGNCYLYMCSYVEHQIPLVISDIIYNLKITIINWMTVLLDDVPSFQKFAYNVRRKFYEMSNNFALLSVIEDVGLHFKNELPGYVIDLVSCRKVLRWDIQRYCLYHKDQAVLISENQMKQILGVDVKSQYVLDPKCDCLLRNYIVDLQLNGPEPLRKKCHDILDYLYSITLNDKKNAEDYLHIQQMDVRIAEKKYVSSSMVSITPVATGAAKDFVEKQKDNVNCDDFLAQCFQEKPIKNADGTINFESVDSAIDSILDIAQQRKEAKSFFENRLIHLISISLSNKDMSQERRDSLCMIWVSGLFQYLNYGSFLSDNQMVPYLWEQLSAKISSHVRFEIKKLMLFLLMFQGPNGIIKDLLKTVRHYLKKNIAVAEQFFTVIVQLANQNKSYYDLMTNCNQILKEDLFNNQEIKNGLFLSKDYNVETLSSISNCGLNLENESFACIMRQLVFSILRTWNDSMSQRASEYKFGIYTIQNIQDFFIYEIIEKEGSANREIDFLFDEVDFSNFKENSIQFYQDIFIWLGTKYFDSYENSSKRSEIEKKIRYIENKVALIANENVKNLFCRFLCLYEGPNYTTDLEKLKTHYSYEDKLFVNGQFEKYGKFNLSEMFQTIQMLHLKELLPEILPSVASCLNAAYQEKNSCLWDSHDFVFPVARSVLTESFYSHSDKIKNDKTLSDSFEIIVDVMIKLGNEYAAVLQDEFRVH